MKKNVERLEKYREAVKTFNAKRKKILKEPEGELSVLSEDLQLYELRRESEADVNRLTDKAWRLYKKIWDGEPSKGDVDRFLGLVDDIMLYEEFVSVEMMKVWRVTRDLIWAFGQSYRQQELVP